MDIHQNARLTPYSREQLAKSVLFQGRTLNSAAAEFKVSGKTARKWVRRYRAENRAGMADRSSWVRRLLTDNGYCYRSRAFAAACQQLQLRHYFTRPYTPRTNGKAERFIQTALREWAYAQAYPHSDVRDAQLPHWLHHYNWHRPHASLKQLPPISRSGLDGNNLLRHHS